MNTQRRMKVRVLAALVLVLVVSASAHAGTLILGGVNVGSITVDDNTTTKTATLGGLNFIAHYTTNAAFTADTHVSVSDLHWIQRATSNKATVFTPVPNRPFIDPRVGQGIGGPTPDNLPWYEFTGPSLTDFSIRDGTGAFIGDGAAAPLNLATAAMSYTFVVESLLVGVFKGMKSMGILGGVRWGYTISVVGGKPIVTALGTTMLSDSAALRAGFNTALNLDYKGWFIQDNSTLWPVPLPTPALLVACGLLCVAGPRRRLLAA